MVKIKVRNGESLEQALRRFNKKVIQANIIKEALKRKEYIKPTTEKREREKMKQRKIYLDNLRK
jgi:small subunit ribosomal protein S21